MARPQPTDAAPADPVSLERPEHPVTTPWVPPTLAAGLYLAFWQAAPRIRTESEGAILISTLVALGLIVWFTASFARSTKSLKVLLIGLVVSALLVLPLKVMLVKVSLGTGHLYAPWSWLLRVPGLSDLIFIWFAASVGGLLSRLLRSANMIPPVAAVLALVDIWTVLFGGPVQRMMQSKDAISQTLTQAMTVPMPGLQRGAAPFRPTSIIGFADFVFIAFFVAALCRLVNVEGSYRRTVRVLIVVLGLYMLAVHLPFAGLQMLPALVPMAVVMIALHWRNFKYERSEAFALLYAALVIAAIVFGAWLFRGRVRPEDETPRAQINSPTRAMGVA